MKKGCLALAMMMLLNPWGAIRANELTVAAGEGNLPRVQQLLDQGLDVNSTDEDGYSVIAKAANKGRPDIVALLIAKGANINTRSKYNTTPLANAVWGVRVYRDTDEQYLATVKLLLDHGAEVNTVDIYGDSPMLKTIDHRDMTTLVLLLAHGGNPNIRKDNEPTPLHMAVARDMNDFVKLLVANGADIKLKDDKKRTPLQIAKENKNSELIAFLTHPEEQSHSALHQRGLAKFRSGDYSGALTDFNQAIALSPQNYDYLRDRGEDELALSDFKAAAEDGTRMAGINATWSDSYYLQARAYAKGGEFSKAREALNAYMNSERRYVSGPQPEHSGKTERSWNRFEMLYDIEKIEHPEAYAAIMNSAAKSDAGDKAGALASAKEAIRLNPDFSNYYTMKAAFEFQLGDMDAARADLQQAIRLDPFISQSYANLGLIDLRTGNKSAAINNFNLATKYDPENATAVTELKRIDDAQWADIQQRAAMDNAYAQRQREAEAAADAERQKKEAAELARIKAQPKEPAFSVPSGNGPCGFSSSCYYDGHYYIGGQKVQTSEERDSTR
ncbi:MAG TPA: ankyrin repeat domain-containing protein [Fluviicoccus sp.]|nr:ankyrin repeat domain-containing protein [Fluviicoccus sp.]